MEAFGALCIFLESQLVLRSAREMANPCFAEREEWKTSFSMESVPLEASLSRTVCLNLPPSMDQTGQLFVVQLTDQR